MTRQAYVGTRPRIAYLAALSAAGLLACASPASTGTSGNGGSNGSGNGGSTSSGNGGSTNRGGSNGSGNGGSNGSGNGGSNSSGNGGSVTSGNGGSNTTGSGGSHTGGTTGSGGSVTSGNGGSNTTGSGGAGGAFTGTNPAGYYSTKDWNVSSVDWHGCVWTGKDSTVTGSTTSVTPQDFTAASKEGGPYEVMGTVYNDYNAVALLGFNLNEAATGNGQQCKYNAAAAMQAGPPSATIPASATGIAVNWSAKKASPTSFRIQLQAADGATNPNDTWCATITDAQGPSFIPFTSFYQKCYYLGTTMSPGMQFNPQQNSIDAIAFLIPGTVGMVAPFDFTIVGFAPGTSKSDAPGGAAACGMASGTLGSATASDAASFQRAAITGTDCHEYIIQNNNWGSPTGSSQVINYAGTGFTVASSSGSGSSAPASFPSTYVGANGNIANGTYNTWSDTGLPKQISSIQSAMTSFGWSGGKSGGQFNVTYDVWFAKTAPSPGTYNDGISGFIMVWLHKPSNFHPIGTAVRMNVPVAGKMWDVWAGPRGSGQGNTGGVNDGAGRPVISYVPSAGASYDSLSFDLKAFMSDAVAAKDNQNGIGQTFSDTWYLTDVFAGFEIWNGGDATGLKSTGFSISVK